MLVCKPLEKWQTQATASDMCGINELLYENTMLNVGCVIFIDMSSYVLCSCNFLYPHK